MRWFVLVALLAACGPPKNPTHTNLERVRTVYESNPTRAANTYKDKWWRISDVKVDVIEDSWVLVGKEEGKQMRFELEHTEDVHRLNVGVRINLICRGRGMNRHREPTFTNCVYIGGK